MLLEGREEQVTQLGFDTRPIDRPCSQSTPDLVYSAALDDQDAAGEPVAQVLPVLSPWSGQSLINECEQLGSQAALKSDRRFGTVAQVIVICRKQAPLLMEMLEVAICVLFRSFLSSASGTEPDDIVLFVAPGHASKVRHTVSVHEGLVDSENPLLTPRRLVAVIAGVADAKAVGKWA